MKVVAGFVLIALLLRIILHPDMAAGRGRAQNLRRSPRKKGTWP
jgi:hypothetical protein